MASQRQDAPLDVLDTSMKAPNRSFSNKVMGSQNIKLNSDRNSVESVNSVQSEEEKIEVGIIDGNSGLEDSAS